MRDFFHHQQKRWPESGLALDADPSEAVLHRMMSDCEQRFPAQKARGLPYLPRKLAYARLSAERRGGLREALYERSLVLTPVSDRPLLRCVLVSAFPRLHIVLFYSCLWNLPTMDLRKKTCSTPSSSPVFASAFPPFCTLEKEIFHLLYLFTLAISPSAVTYSNHLVLYTPVYVACEFNPFL
jgi:hypothetical protein